VFTARFSGPRDRRGGRNALETELHRLGVQQKNGKPNHPQTQGKVERFQQTMKKWLTAQQPQPATVAQLQALLDTFTSAYNQQRPHRSLPRRATPAAAYAARPRATPGQPADLHDRVRTDTVSTSGTVTLRTGGRLHHIGIGRAHAGTSVLMLTHGLHIRVLDAATGQQLRELTLDPTRDYQPTGTPKGPTRTRPAPPSPSP
jgi:hypothetical protein